MGCARVVRNRWRAGFAQAPNCQLRAIASRDLNKAKTWASDLTIPIAYGHYDALLADPDIDAVFMALPNNLHAPWAIRAMEAGKHVLCDKPLALNADEARRMVEAAERCGRLLVEGFMYSYHSQYDRIRQWLAEGRIGPLKMIRMAFSFNLDRSGDFRYDPAMGGGALLDLGCYCGHVMRLIAGRLPRRVQATAQMLPGGVDGAMAAILEFDEELTGVFDCALTYAGYRFLQLAGPGGLIISSAPITPEPQITLTLKTEKETIQEIVNAPNLYASLIADMQRQIARGVWTPSPARDSILNHQVMDAIAQSARTGRPIIL